MSTLRTNEELVAEIQKENNTEENKVQLYRQNKGLILKFAKMYMRDEGELEDYLSEGYFAVEKACNYYDPEKGTSFSTILGYCIRYYFAEYTRKGQLVGIPREVRENGIKYGKVRGGLLMEKGEADDVEIMDRLGLTKNSIKAIKASYMFSVINSLDEPILNQDGSITNISEFVADGYNLEESAEEKQINEILWECVGGILTEKRLEVLKMHFQNDMSVSQIAKEKGLSRQAVSNMLILSMEKLRKSKKLKKLYESL